MILTNNKWIALSINVVFFSIAGYFGSALFFEKEIVKNEITNDAKPRFRAHYLDKKSNRFLDIQNNYAFREFQAKILNFGSSDDFLKEWKALEKNSYYMLSPNTILFFYSSWAEISPQAAIEAVSKSSNDVCLRLAPNKIYKLWGEHNPEGLLAALQSGYLPANSRNEALWHIARGLTLSAPQLGLAYIKKLPIEQQTSGTQAYLNTIINKYPDLIDETLSSIPDHYLDNKIFLNNLMEELTVNDIDKALSWRNTLSEKQKESLAIYGKLSTDHSLNNLEKEMDRSPEEFFNKLNDYPENLQIQIWDDMVISLYFSKGFNEALKWIEKNASERFKDMEGSRMINAFSYSLLPEELKSLVDNAKSEFQKEIYGRAYLSSKNFNSHSYPEAIKYATNLNSIDDAMNLIGKWLKDDPSSAQSWLNSTTLFDTKGNLYK